MDLSKLIPFSITWVLFYFILSYFNATMTGLYCHDNTGLKLKYNRSTDAIFVNYNHEKHRIETDQKYDRCYVWFKTEDTCGVFPLGEKSVILASVNHDRTILCNALDHIEVEHSQL